MRILIVRLGAIGDVVHTLPALSALRRAMPEAHLAWAVERGASAGLLEDNPCLDELIELEMRGRRKEIGRIDTLRTIRESISKLRKSRFEIALDFQGLLKSAMIPWLAGIPRRIGFADDALRERASGIFLNDQVVVDDSDHVIKKNLRLVEFLGCDASGQFRFPIGLTRDDEHFADEQSDRLGGSFAILNPGGGWPTKLWAPEGFAGIADLLWEAYGMRSAITYGPAEEEAAQTIVNQSRTRSAVMVEAGLKQFFALARKSSLFLGGDTGPMHLAAAAGVPVVAIFGPTSARRNGPFSDEDRVIERFDLDCRTDCYRRSCSHISCMKIPVETVWRGIEARLHTANEQEERKTKQTKITKQTNILPLFLLSFVSLFSPVSFFSL